MCFLHPASFDEDEAAKVSKKETGRSTIPTITIIQISKVFGLNSLSVSWKRRIINFIRNHNKLGSLGYF
ncbi:MAG: hypothetical protein WA941_03360 [Nitrososphaeraceae archaeon]